MKEINENLRELKKQSKKEGELSKLRYYYFMQLGSINKFQAIIIGSFVALVTSFLIFFLQGGNILELFDLKIISGEILGSIIIILIISFIKLNLAINKKKEFGNQIRKIEERTLKENHNKI